MAGGHWTGVLENIEFFAANQRRPYDINKNNAPTKNNNAPNVLPEPYNLYVPPIVIAIATMI